MRLLKILCCIAYLISCVTGTNVRVDPLVITSHGLVRGQRATDGDYSTFLGIPFAQVDPNNPFGESLPYPNFEEVFDAADGSSECPPDKSRDWCYIW
ncbi:hypothetical protein EVAR_20159_1 [Eumeta japonica]|uniref:Uncharacterized protein n=1 Tax=Eumeta variegata TaxID=151549 RepID=A0A4C1V2D5_EUMVA|nr:hypothetical protein EVAR_20159_1 [Eumeta japonica]